MTDLCVREHSSCRVVNGVFLSYKKYNNVYRLHFCDRSMRLRYGGGRET